MTLAPGSGARLGTIVPKRSSAFGSSICKSRVKFHPVHYFVTNGRLSRLTGFRKTMAFQANFAHAGSARASLLYELCANSATFATFCLTHKNIYVFVLGRKILENHCRLTHNNISAFVLGSQILENRFLVFVLFALMKAIEKTPISPVVATSIDNSSRLFHFFPKVPCGCE